MYISEVKQEIIDNYRLKISSLVWGPPGVGKSDLVRQVAQELNIACKDERIPTLDPVDLRGVPSVEDGYTLFNIPSLLPRVDRDGEFGLFFLDELPAAQPAMQAAAYQLTLDRKIGDYTLPDGWSIVAAGNNLGDKAVSYRQSTALANRFGHYDLEVNVDEWLAWGLKSGISEDLLAFIKYRPNLLHDMEAKDGKMEHAFPSPRTWNFVAQHQPFMTPQNEFNKIKAFVGESAAIEFNHFMKIIRELPTIDEIMNNPMTARLPEALDAIHATTSVILKNVTLQNFPTLMKYINRIPTEFQALFTNEAIKRDEDIADTQTYTDWAVATSTKIY
jgi:hypothetical protein